MWFHDFSTYFLTALSDCDLISFRDKGYQLFVEVHFMLYIILNGKKKSPDPFLGHLNMQMIYKSCRHFASPFIPSDSVLVLTFGNTEINLLNQAKVYSQSLPIFSVKNKQIKQSKCLYFFYPLISLWCCA